MNKKEEIEELYKTLEIIYTENITYLEKEHPQLFKRLLKFEKTNPNDYNINFDNNQFELLHRNKKTYNCNPFYDALCRVESLKKNSSTISLLDMSNKKLLHKDFELEANNVLNQYIENINKLQIPDQKVKSEKFIFMGTLLGIHLNDIHKLIKAKSYLIIEPNFEIFRLSLFLTDYTELAQNAKLFFAINENLNQIINSFLKHNPKYNHFIRFEIASENEMYLLEEVSTLLIQEGETLYPYSEYLLSLERGFNYFFKNYNLIETNTNNHILNNFPILYLGAGPSLSKNENFIKNNQDKFLIVAIAATLKKLEELNIIPHIILSTDSGGDDAVSEQFKVSNYLYQNSIVILSIKTQEEIVNLFPKNNLFFANDSFEIFANSGVNTGSTVGDVGYKILSKLGAKDIYLLGFDGAIDSKTGATHDKSYYSTKHKIHDFNIKEENKLSSSNYLTKVKGNFQKEVYTTLLYKSMIEEFEKTNKKYQLNSYNLSDGAFIKGSIPFKETIKKNKLIIDKEKLLANLNTIKKQNLTLQDIKDIKIEKEVLKKLEENKDIDTLLNIYENSVCLSLIKKFLNLIDPYENYLEYHNQKSELKNKLLKELISKLQNIYNLTL